MNVLVVEDDAELVALLSFMLAREGFTVVSATDLATALTLIEEAQPVLALIDINLGAWNGLDLLRALRRRGRLPVILLSGRSGEDDKVQGLELGADDYITKPFGHRELVARIRAVLRRAGHDDPTTAAAARELVCGPLRMSVREHTVTFEGSPIRLAVREFQLLHYLLSHAGVVVTTAELLRHVWGHSDLLGGDHVRVAIHRLRGKLDDDAAEPRLIHTIPGVGFMLRWDPPAGTAV
jgi:two-component system response regulator RegX3